MGYFNRAAILTGPTVQLGDADNPPTPEQIHENWDKINAMDGAQEIEDANSAILTLITPPGPGTGGDAAGDQASGDVQAIIGKKK
jgi:hypothetical protein